MRERDGSSGAELPRLESCALPISVDVLETALEAAGIGTWEWDVPSGRVIWSRGTATLFGEEPGVYAVTYEGYLARVHPEDRAAVAAVVEALARGERDELVVEHRLSSRSHAERWLEGRGRVFRDAAGAPVRMIGTVHDVTARKRIELHLAAEQRFISSVLDTIGTLVIVLDVDARIRLFSRACEVATGYREAEVLGSSFVDLLVLPDEAAGVRAVFKRLVAKDFPNKHENFWRRRDGTLVRIAWSNTAILDENGEVRFVIGTGTDVTEARMMALALKTSEQRLELALEAAGLGTWDWDVREDRVLFDERSARLVGFDAGELPKSFVEWRALLHPEDEPAAVAAIDAHLAGETPLLELEERLRTKGGRYAWFLTRGKVVAWDERGRPLRMAGTLEDITNKKSAEAQALRTQRLESLGMIAGGIAHDLNNTLSPILMAVDSLRSEHPALRSHELLDLMEQSAVRAAGLVQQVLLFARGMDGLRVPLDVGQLVTEAQKLLRETFPKNVRIALFVAEGLPSVLGDETQLQQVLVNLCVNARDAMPKGGVLTLAVEEIVVRSAAATPALKAGRWVRIRVRDQGSGVAPGDLEHIFDPFFTTKEPGKGTGLGLPTVLAIVRRHNGLVLVDTELGVGTTFDVYLPATTAPVRVADGERPVVEQGHGELVLVVDDEAPVRSLATRTLERGGYRVIAAADGAEAIALFERHRNDVRIVVTDLMMPNTDGAAALSAIRALSPSVPVIAMSGLPSGEHVAAVSAAGARSVLAKPFSADSLLRAVAHALADSRALGPPPEEPTS